MKRAAAQLFNLRDKAKIALFFKISLIKTPRANPRADPRAKQRSENPTPGATKICESPGVARWGWSGLELTDTLHIIWYTFGHQGLKLLPW